MIDRHRYVIAGAVAACLVLLAWMIVPRRSSTTPTADPRSPSTPAPTASAPDAETAAEPSDASGRATRTYALHLSELKGLPADASPGTRVEIWVSWEPPVTDKTKLQRLIPVATVDRIIPPFAPEAPPTVVLALPNKAVPDLLYGDRYGALSALVLP